LSAIFAADVAGYSRLVGLDEEGTLGRFKNYRASLIDPKIAEHRGRVVRTNGDGMLAEFVSAVDAARCAVDIQLAIASANFNIAATQRVELRIGIHVGDIVSDDGDIFGDGVNIAARLEARDPWRHLRVGPGPGREQGAATQEIAVQQAAHGTQQVSSNITDVQRGASETGSASSQVLAAAKSLSDESARLKREVGKFLGSARAA
jgi:Adenylate and Guanylate cyclase catalytic domain